MNTPLSDWKRLDELIGALRDEELSPDQATELNALLKAQPGARRRFAESMHLTAMLESNNVVDRSAIQRSDRGAINDNAPIIAGRTRRFRAITSILLVTTVAALAVLFWPEPNGTPHESLVELFDEGVAVVTQSYDARWVSETQLQIGSSVAPGTFELASGLIQLEFYRGAVVVVEGPAKLEFVSADRVICHKGRLRAHVPPPAEGFAVLSPNVELVDLGTEFGMDVADDGSASVHVFDGKVELYEAGTDRAAATRREFAEAEGAVISTAGEIVKSSEATVEFVSAAELSELTTRRSSERFEQWKAHRRNSLNDGRVVLRFGFEQDNSAQRLLRSDPTEDGQRHGAIIGCRWTEGRWPGKDALEFKHPGDRVRLQIPGEFDSLTWSAWVRIDGLDRPFIALMLTNGYEVGEPHWQLRDDGRLLLGIQTPFGHVAYDSKPVLNIKHLGRWTHLATVYDSQSARVTHYINGENVGELPITTENFKLRFGETEIGNWGAPGEYSPQKIRNFNGQIDEVTLFRKALTAKEIQSLYTTGLR